VGRGEKPVSQKHCPRKNLAPALCYDCAFAVRVIDEEEEERCRKAGELNVAERVWQCPDKLILLYLADIAKKLDSLANAIEGLTEATEKR